MNRKHWTIIAAVCICATALAVPATASAGATYNFDITLQSPAISGNYFISRLDSSKNTTVRVTRGGIEQDRQQFGSGSTNANKNVAFQPGDVVEVYQPQADGADPPLATPVETFTVPNVSIVAAVGDSNVSGLAGGASAVRVRSQGSCFFANRDSVGATIGGANFAAKLASPVAPGDLLGVVATEANGNRVYNYSQAPGEVLCGELEGTTLGFYAGPGPTPPTDQPFSALVAGMVDPSISDSRVVVRRGSNVLSDTSHSSPGSAYAVGLSAAQRPQPGDTLDIYRPDTAPTPAASWTVPQVSAIFDPDSDLVAVDGPASSGVTALACRAVDCGDGATVSQSNTKDGRTVMSFKNPAFGGFIAGFGGFSPAAYDLRRDDQVAFSWTSPDRRFIYSGDAALGDLMPPTVSLRAGKSIDLTDVDKSIKVNLTSSEAGKGKVKLRLKPSVSARRAGHLRNKTITIASDTLTVKAGKNKVKLKVTRAGRELIDELVKLRKRIPNQRAKFEATVTDNAGNAGKASRKFKFLTG